MVLWSLPWANVVTTSAERFSLISQSILNRFTCNFAHTIRSHCGDCPEILVRFDRVFQKLLMWCTETTLFPRRQSAENAGRHWNSTEEVPLHENRLSNYQHYSDIGPISFFFTSKVIKRKMREFLYRFWRCFPGIVMLRYWKHIKSFLSNFIVFCDHENMGIDVKINTVAWLVMEISEEIDLSLMAALICVFLKMLKGANVASSSL